MKNVLNYLIFFVCFYSIYSQVDKPAAYYLGAFASYNYNIHLTDFNTLPGIPCCGPHFEEGNGHGFALGGLFDYNIKEDILLGARIGISSIGGTLEKNDIIGNTSDFKTDPNHLIIEQVESKYTINSSIYSLGIEPNISIRLLKNFNISLGVRLAYLFYTQFDQKEEIVRPNYVTFFDGKLTRSEVNDKAIPELNPFQVHGIFAIGYEFPIYKDWLLMPELRYQLPFIDISSVTWKAASLQIGAALRIPFYPDTEKKILYDTIRFRDTTTNIIADLDKEIVFLVDIIKENKIESKDKVIINTTIFRESYKHEIPDNPKPTANIIANGIAADGAKQTNPTIIIEEFELEEQFPLLTQVFFEPNSSDLTMARLHLLKKEQTSGFSENNLLWGTLEIYKELLNIIGLRLKNNPSFNINLQGSISNEAIEKENPKLAINRAESIKKYLIDIWGISPNRIATGKQNIDLQVFARTEKDIQDENRRCQIYSSNFDIIKPVALKKIDKVSNPPMIEIFPIINSKKDISVWDIQIKQSDKLLRKYEGTGKPSPIKWEVAVNPIPEFETPIEIVLSGKDINNNNFTASTTLNIQQKTIRKKRYELIDDKRIERFALILFDFDKFDINQNHKTILDSIKYRIKPNSKVIIAGYADRIGNPEYNRDLASKRNLEAQKILKIKPENCTLQSIGSDQLLYNNDFPEGRSYCRTVKITIETPIKE